MNPLIWMVALLAGGAAVMLALAARARAGQSHRALPLVVRRPLSAPELALVHRVRQALPDHIVLAQVPLVRLVEVRGGERNARALVTRLEPLEADLVVCDAQGTPLAALELATPKARDSARRGPDSLKERALRSVGITVVHCNTADLPEPDALRDAVLAAARVAVAPAPKGKAATRRARIEPVLGDAPADAADPAPTERRRGF